MKPAPNFRFSPRPKKSLSQHFLTDEGIANDIAGLLEASGSGPVVEIGPGTGMLTRRLFERFGKRLWLVEADQRMIYPLKHQFPKITDQIICGDFLRFPLKEIFGEEIALIGNLPYQISSSILFKVMENREYVTEMVAMLQKEVAERIAANPGTRNSGILTILLQTFFEVTLEIRVNADKFRPVPKVDSAVVKIRRRKNIQINCRVEDLSAVVKKSFGQRRKMLRNSLGPELGQHASLASKYGDRRPEQLVVADFIELARGLNENRNLQSGS